MFFLLDETFAFVLFKKNDYFYVKNFCFLYLKNKNKSESFHGPVPLFGFSTSYHPMSQTFRLMEWLYHGSEKEV